MDDVYRQIEEGLREDEAVEHQQNVADGHNSLYLNNYNLTLFFHEGFFLFLKNKDNYEIIISFFYLHLNHLE